jgi:hypothetical protein
MERSFHQYLELFVGVLPCPGEPLHGHTSAVVQSSFVDKPEAPLAQQARRAEVLGGALQHSISQGHALDAITLRIMQVAWPWPNFRRLEPGRPFCTDGATQFFTIEIMSSFEQSIHSKARLDKISKAMDGSCGLTARV